MTTLLGIAFIIAALGTLVLRRQIGCSYVIWARRCDPKNPSFRPPDLPGSPPKK